MIYHHIYDIYMLIYMIYLGYMLIYKIYQGTCSYIWYTRGTCSYIGYIPGVHAHTYDIPGVHAHTYDIPGVHAHIWDILGWRCAWWWWVLGSIPPDGWVPGTSDPTDRCSPPKMEHHNPWYLGSGRGTRAYNPHQVYSICAGVPQSRGCCHLAPCCLPSVEPEAKCRDHPSFCRPRPAW